MTNTECQTNRMVSQETNCGEKNFSYHIVGVGASAGGLEALERMFSAMPLDSGVAFVIVQHLSPDFRSHMDNLLSRVTRIPVHIVTDGEIVQPNTIYLIPPAKEMVISNRKLLLTDRSTERVLSYPIDRFLRSLAQDVGPQAIGVILSGTGSDGSRGVVDIDEYGGCVMVQEPSTCRFDAMPVNARDTGRVTMVLAPEEIGPAIQAYVRDGKVASPVDNNEIDSKEEGGLSQIFVLLQRAHKIDFSLYKSGTVGRRVQRRIVKTKCANLDAYVDLLNQDYREVDELSKDLLIGVTRFFRDTDAFQVLELDIIPAIVQKAVENSTIRIWVCACATGEEAYSLAILFSEAIERTGKNVDFKIFATDVHRTSLQFAAAGIFPESAMRDVSEERREKFFVRRLDGYLINTDLRRSVVFAPHNFISDPPFTRMDMVTCRNVLIYLRPPAQRKSLSLFHFALKLGGVLFLGPSESTGDIADEFESVNKHWKIFRKRNDIRLPFQLRMPTQSTSLTIPQPRPQQPAHHSSVSREIMPALYDQLLNQFMPPSVVVDERFDILHVFSGAEPFLRVVTGRPTANLLDQILPSLRTTLASALRHAQRDQAPVHYARIPHPNLADDHTLRLSVDPVKVDGNKTCFLVQFELQQSATDSRQGSSPRALPGSNSNVSDVAQNRIDSLERDLDYSQQNLQATIEELEASNEELQAANEEMVAANEELQSTNEELHSVNEELYTVNAEHQQRLAELDEANADMNNLLASTGVGVVFLDSQLYIRRFTPAVGRMFFLEKHDIGRSFKGCLDRTNDATFMDRLNEILEKGVEREWEVTVNGESYLVRALPYWTESKIGGVVVAFVNVQPLKKAQAELAKFKYMCDAAYDGQILTDENARMVYFNEAFSKQLGYDYKELLEMTVMQFDAQHDFQAYQQKLKAAIQNSGSTFESVYRRKDGSTIPVEVSLTHVTLSDKPFLYGQVRDISERCQENDRLRLLESAVATASNGIVIVDAQHRDQPITFVNQGFLKITGYHLDDVIGRNCRFLQSEQTSAESIAIIRDGIKKAEPVRVTLLNQRKDGGHFWNDLYVTPVRNHSGNLTHFVGVQNDVTERIKAVEAAQSSEKTIRLLLNSTAEGIYGIDEYGNCTFCNMSAAKILGYDDPDELISRSMHSLIHHSYPNGACYPEELCPIYQCLNDGQKISKSGEVFWKKDGTAIPVQYWSHAIFSENRVIGAVITFVDITERLAFENELRDARDRADLASQTKSRFLANISHELRTPMAAILGFTEILQQEVTDKQVAERLDAIRRNGDYLLRLLNDVLDLSRIEAGKMNMSKSTVDLPELLVDVAELMRIRTREYKNTLSFVVIGKIPKTITIDEARLRQVLINLIANALKFSPGGQVQLLASMTADSRLEFQVVDNGIGMDANQQRSLFQPFTQASSEITERFGGTGLGLSITKRLVEAMDGEISVFSEVRKGSTFTVTLPIFPFTELIDWQPGASPSSDRVDMSKNAVTAPPADPIKLNARVLVADDMRDVRYIAEHFLKKAGCTVSIVEDGLQAITAIEQAIADRTPFDLVLMDVQMPVMTGSDAIQELRARKIDVPVIALTADAMKGTRQRLIGLGFNDYMSKPLVAEKLIQIASKLLKS